MIDGVDLSFAASLPPRDAIHYFESKGLRITFNWRDMWQEAHARAFTVAGVAKADLLKDIRDATAQALREGKTESWFADALTPVLQRKGWWGEEEAVNPDTGEVRNVKQGSPSRLGLIYQQNMQSAYNAGRYKQQMEDVADNPWWEYVAVMDERTRPGHKVLHRRVFRYDDIFWQTHYPPNGWRCRCRVRAHNAADLKHYGLTPESGAERMVERGVALPGRNGQDGARRTVSGYRVDGPQGRDIAWTDAGFSYNPGEVFLRDLYAQMPEPPQTAATDWRALGLPSFKDMPEAQRLPNPGKLPRAADVPEAERQLASALGFEGGEALRMVDTPMGKRTIWRDMGGVSLGHMVEKMGDGRERYANFVLPTLTQPHEIWLKNHQDGYLRENYVSVFQGEKYGVLCVVRINRDGSVFFNVMQRDVKGVDAWREGWLVWQKKS